MLFYEMSKLLVIKTSEWLEFYLIWASIKKKFRKFYGFFRWTFLILEVDIWK